MEYMLHEKYKVKRADQHCRLGEWQCGVNSCMRISNDWSDSKEDRFIFNLYCGFIWKDSCEKEIQFTIES